MLWFFLLSFLLYLGYSIGLLYGQDISIENVFDRLQAAMMQPFPVRVTPYTGNAVLLLFMIWLIAYLYYLTGIRNYMSGMEYGTARIADAKELRGKLADKDQHNSKILSQNMRLSMDSSVTKLNNNLLCIGGSGTGKSFRLVKPNGYNCRCNHVFLDPKGELLRSIGNYLESSGYRVRVLNLVDMAKSDGYNPFAYIRKDEDIIKLITNLIANTTPKNSNPNDPFWEKAEGMFLQAIMFYVWYEFPKQGKTPNFRGVLELLNKARISDDSKETSELDRIMYALPFSHPARLNYEKVCSGAADTIRSIIISAHSRLAYLQNESILRILDHDDIDIPSLGEGVYANPDRKTALFCVIPDNDKSYNFLVGMLYTQMFQELYYLADYKYYGRLPVDVEIWMDEFPNVALPDDFLQILATCRSRGIGCNIFIQALAQLKVLFKDAWETVVGNCDTLVYLGSNEPGTHEYISKMLGKKTIDKKTTGETRGRNGSSSRNYDVFGRELLMPDEVRTMDNDLCLIFINGYAPVVDEKFRTWEQKEFKTATEMGEYSHDKADMDQAGKINFYIDAEGRDGAIKSVRYQNEAYGGIFAESCAYKYLIDCTESGYKRFPDRFGGYLYQGIEIYPVFLADPETVSLPIGKLHKHRIAGYYTDHEFVKITKEEIPEIFNPENRIIPLQEAS